MCNKNIQELWSLYSPKAQKPNDWTRLYSISNTDWHKKILSKWHCSRQLFVSPTALRRRLQMAPRHICLLQSVCKKDCSYSSQRFTTCTWQMRRLHTEHRLKIPCKPEATPSCTTAWDLHRGALWPGSAHQKLATWQSAHVGPWPFENAKFPVKVNESLKACNGLRLAVEVLDQNGRFCNFF